MHLILAAGCNDFGRDLQGHTQEIQNRQRILCCCFLVYMSDMLLPESYIFKSDVKDNSSGTISVCSPHRLKDHTVQ